MNPQAVAARGVPWREPLRRLVSRLPVAPPSFALARALDRLLLPRLGPTERLALSGRAVELLVSDLGLRARVTLGSGGFRVAAGGDAVSVRIIAPLDTYLRLARGTDDADRLFFERALMMEGDTELGLVIKNTLDAIGPLWG